MDLGLNEKRAIVMGSTRGMGRGIAERLAQEGARVAICGRKLEDAEEVAAGTPGARAYSLDLSNATSVDALI